MRSLTKGKEVYIITNITNDDVYATIQDVNEHGVEVTLSHDWHVFTSEVSKQGTVVFLPWHSIVTISPAQ